jgi:hypothetical protein
VDADGKHVYEECSGKGICDRALGDCTCFDGYSGRACQRTTCPNDCSGHGKCRFISELDNVGTYTDWDANAIQTCVCDGGYTGSDCSQRLCPKGDDPMTACSASPDHQQQTVTIDFQGDSLSHTALSAVNHMVLKFKDSHGEVWTTRAVDVTSVLTNSAVAGAVAAVEADIKAALEALPNFVIGDATIELDSDPATPGKQTSQDSVSFTVQMLHPDGSTMGEQALLMCPDVNGCTAAGCQPVHQQIRKVTESHPGIVALNTDSVLVPPAFAATGEEYDMTITVTITTGMDASAHNFAIAIDDAGGSAIAAAAMVAQPIPVDNDKVYVGYGAYLNFNSRTVATGTYTIKFAVAQCAVTETVTASVYSEHAECSNRGACDRETGLCQCFDGYYGHNCAQQSILV